jgi:hypothetical protein
MRMMNLYPWFCRPRQQYLVFERYRAMAIPAAVAIVAVMATVVIEGASVPFRRNEARLESCHEPDVAQHTTARLWRTGTSLPRE